MSNIKSARPCRFNQGVGCTYQECSRCGWNPSVKRYRVAEWKNEQIRLHRFFRYPDTFELGGGKK